MALADVHLTDGTENKKRMPPGLDVLLAAAGVFPLVVCALVSLSAVRSTDAVAVTMAVAYGGCLLCFLGGVRRGLSFRQGGGPTVAQIAATVWLFALGAATIFLPWRVLSLLLLMIGLGSVLVLDSMAARRSEVPRYFLVLRPVQVTVAIASVLILLVRSSAL